MASRLTAPVKMCFIIPICALCVPLFCLTFSVFKPILISKFSLFPKAAKVELNAKNFLIWNMTAWKNNKFFRILLSLIFAVQTHFKYLEISYMFHDVYKIQKVRHIFQKHAAFPAKFLKSNWPFLSESCIFLQRLLTKIS